MVAAKKQTKKDLESKIAELEAKLNQLSEQITSKPAEAKPAEAKPAEAKPAEAKPAEAKPDKKSKAKESPKEAPKPAETTSQPQTRLLKKCKFE